MNNTPEAKYLGQLLLMQSVVTNLPGKESIFSFVCHGLIDMPGIKCAYHVEKQEIQLPEKAVMFPVKVDNYKFGALVLELSDPEMFNPYREYIKNFVFTIGVILEERALRAKNEQHKAELEKKVNERTRQLTLEIEERKNAEKELKSIQLALKQQNEEYLAINEELRESNERIQKINEDLVIAKEKAEESDRLKSAFLANMSHEVRTPMNAIVGFADILSNNNITPEQKHHYINIIQMRAFDLLRLVEDILDVSKIEVGQLTILYKDAQLAEMCKDLQEYYLQKSSNVLYQKKIEIRLNLEQELKGIRFRTDPSRLRQVFTNLLDNAFKFTNEGYIEFGCKKHNSNELLFYVKDTGDGIPPDKIELIFDRFRMADENLSARKFGGSGLGLSIVKGIIKLLGGNVWCESEPGIGSTFYFTLPYNPDLTPEEAKPKARKPIEHWSNKNILIVEDDDINMELLCTMLDNHGLQTLKAYNGEQAMEIFNNAKKIDLVLMDIRLPDTNGLILTQMMMDARPSLKIIAQTAYASEDDKQACLNAGCIDYISKPIALDKLNALLKRNL